MHGCVLGEHHLPVEILAKMPAGPEVPWYVHVYLLVDLEYSSTMVLIVMQKLAIISILQ